MLRHTRMVSTRQVPAYATGNGFAAICPTCGKDNHAHYGEDGKLVWWPNGAIGTWCRHCEGAYSGGGLSTVFQFKYLPLVANGQHAEPQAKPRSHLTADELIPWGSNFGGIAPERE